MIDLEQYKPNINKTCNALPIKRLSLFGSILNDNFSDQSDIDVLVSIDDREDLDRFEIYFQLKENLENIFERTVDLVIEKKFNNPLFQKSVSATKVTIYER